MKVLKNIIGCRTEELYGSKQRDLKAVTIFELEELGNDDILTTLNMNKKEALRFINNLYAKGYKYCIWLCRNKKDLINSYGQYDNLDFYKIKNGIVISDIGEEGRLVAYKKEDVECLN